MDLDHADATGLTCALVQGTALTQEHYALFTLVYPTDLPLQSRIQQMKSPPIVVEGRLGGKLAGFIVLSMQNSTIWVLTVCKDPGIGPYEVLGPLIGYYMAEPDSPFNKDAPLIENRVFRLWVDPRNTRLGTEYGRILYYTRIGFRLDAPQSIRLLVGEKPDLVTVESHSSPLEVGVKKGDSTDTAYIGSVRSAGQALRMTATVNELKKAMTLTQFNFPHRTPSPPGEYVVLYSNTYNPDQFPYPDRTYLGYHHMSMLTNFANPNRLRTFKVPPQITLVLVSMPGSILTIASGNHFLIARGILRSTTEYATFVRKFSGFPVVPIETVTTPELIGLQTYRAGIKSCRVLESVEQRELITVCMKPTDFAEGVLAQDKVRKTQLDYQVYPPNSHCHDFQMAYARSGFGQPNFKGSTLDTLAAMGSYELLNVPTAGMTIADKDYRVIPELNELVGETTTLQAYLWRMVALPENVGKNITVFVVGCATIRDVGTHNMTYEILHRRSLNTHITLENLPMKVLPFLTTPNGTILDVIPMGCPPVQQGGGEEEIPLVQYQYPNQPDIFDDFSEADPAYEPVQRPEMLTETSAMGSSSSSSQPSTLETSAEPLLVGESQLTVKTEESEEERSPSAKRKKVGTPPPESPAGDPMSRSSTLTGNPFSSRGSTTTGDPFSFSSRSSTSTTTPPHSGPLTQPPPQTPQTPVRGELKQKEPSTSGHGRRLPSLPTPRVRRSSSSSKKRYTRRQRALRS